MKQLRSKPVADQARAGSIPALTAGRGQADLFVDNSRNTIAVRQLSELLERSPRTVAQRAQIAMIQGETLQRRNSLTEPNNSVALPNQSTAPPATIQRRRYSKIARAMQSPIIGPLGDEPAAQAAGVMVAIQSGDHGLLGKWIGDLSYYDAEDWGDFVGELSIAGKVWIRGYLSKNCEPGLLKRLVDAGLPAPLQPVATTANEEENLAKKLTGKGIDPQFAAAALQAAAIAKPDLRDNARVALSATICLIYRRVDSILAKGVLLTSQLESSQIDHTPSSDSFAARSASFFDIDLNRNTEEPEPYYDERFPYPGHQSINPVLERRDDIQKMGKITLNAASRVTPNQTALDSVLKLQSDEGHEGTVESFIVEIRKSESLQRRLGAIARFNEVGIGELEARAASSAMVLSTGKQREQSLLVKEKWVKRQGFGPKVVEMRASQGLEPEAITHVLLPDFMQGFQPIYWWGKDIRFVGEVTTRVGYYDAGSRVSKELELRIPNYQQALDQVLNEVGSEMITHITNV